MDKYTFNPCDECKYGIYRRDGSGSDHMCRICEFQELLRRAQPENKPVDVVPVVRGEWINKPKTCVFICSMCGREVKTFHTNDIKVVNDEYPFCHCGAKMDGERRESEVRE